MELAKCEEDADQLNTAIKHIEKVGNLRFAVANLRVDAGLLAVVVEEIISVITLFFAETLRQKRLANLPDLFGQSPSRWDDRVD